MPDQSFNLLHLWATSDGVSRTVGATLLLMSIACWYLILAKAIDWWRMRRAAQVVSAFWRAKTVREGIDALQARGADSPFGALAFQAQCCHHDIENA